MREATQETSDIKTKVFTMDTLKIDFEKYKVFVEDKEIHMTPIEYKLLVLLVENAGKVLTHSFIIRKIWGYSTTEDSQSLRVLWQIFVGKSKRTVPILATSSRKSV